MSNDEMYKELEDLRQEIDNLKSFNTEMLEKLDEIWESLTSLSLDMIANKADVDLVCRELIRKERVS